MSKMKDVLIDQMNSQSASKSNAEYLHDLIANLSKPMPYQWRVQSFNKSNTKCTCVAYIDARQAMDTLDKYCVYGWTKKYLDIKGSIYCSIGIVMPDGSIIERQDVGSEGNFEAEKSAASDAFKRAAVNFGVGRFLYDLDIVDLDAGSKEFNGKQYPFPADKNGNKIWDITEHINKMQGVVDGVHPLQEALQKLSGMNDKAKAIEWAKTLPDSVKTHASFRQAFSKQF
jgi:hypothetical protein